MAKSKTVCLLALASAVAAQDLALSSFDPLSSNRIPPACKDAYMAPINGCRRSDFTTNASCSPECVRGVQEMEENIQANCGGVLLPVDTLLAQALLGNLQKVLCPDTEAPPPEETTAEETPAEETTIVFPSTTEQPTTIIFSTTLRDETTSETEAEPSTFVTTTSSSSTETLVLPSQTPTIPSPDPIPSPTENEGTAETARNDDEEEEEENTFSPGPGGNDILNPASAASSLVPRLDLVVLVAAVTYLIW